jgi:NTE family protein
LATADSAAARESLSPAVAANLDEGSAAPEAGIGLCLSGGGYRAMLFHIGALWRLNDACLLSKLNRISSVSGGSITAGVLAMNWARLGFDANGSATNFISMVVDPIRTLANTTIDTSSVIGGILTPGASVSDEVETHYRKLLYGNATLQDLPDSPRFVFNATNVQSSALWRFSKPYMGDYRVGLVQRPLLALASAVAASSAFPPVLSPHKIDLHGFTFTPDPTCDLQRAPFTTTAVLADGGVYDNLGLETVWKRYQTILVSDAGAKIQAEESPHEDWARHLYRILDIIDNQVRSLRARQIVGSLKLPVTDPLHRYGALWTIRTNIAEYGLATTLPCPFPKTTELAQIPTRLAAMDNALQERVINWGFAVTDAALRAYFDTSIPPASPFPYVGGVN